MTSPRRFDSQPSPEMPRRAGTGHHGNETYLALVWRRLKRSWTGMIGLILVCLLMLMAIFADFFSPDRPEG